jgi:hypothetical protein
MEPDHREWGAILMQIAMYSQNSMIKALPSGNSLATGFTLQTPTIIRPDYAYGQNTSGKLISGVQSAKDGYITWGSGGEAEGIEAPARIKLIPYCEDSSGAQFSIRLYSWQKIAVPDATNVIWFPTLIVELLCTAGTIPGIKGRWIKDTENFCEQIQVTNGSLGPWYGGLWSYSRGSGLAAFVMVDTVGARFLSFDFAMTNPETNTGMNCLWCRA